MNSLLQYVTDQAARVQLYWRCRSALMQGHMARVFMQSRTYKEGTPEYDAWLLGIDGVLSIYITTDFKVQAL